MYSFRLRRGNSAQWASVDPILDAGEQGVEIDTGIFKIGNGYQRWSQLDRYLPEEEMLEAIEVAVAATVFDDSAATQALMVHINSPEPHAVYDDGPSLLLLYQNAKV